MTYEQTEEMIGISYLAHAGDVEKLGEQLENEGALSVQKIDEMIMTVKNLEASAEGLRAQSNAVRAEATRLAMAAKQQEDDALNIKKAIQNRMEHHSLKKIESELFSLSIVNNGGKKPLKLNCLAESLPPAYQLVETVVSANKDQIRADLEQGIKLPFAEFGERGKRLSIK